MGLSRILYSTSQSGSESQKSSQREDDEDDDDDDDDATLRFRRLHNFIYYLRDGSALPPGCYSIDTQQYN